MPYSFKRPHLYRWKPLIHNGRHLGSMPGNTREDNMSPSLCPSTTFQRHGDPYNRQLVIQQLVQANRKENIKASSLRRIKKILSFPPSMLGQFVLDVTDLLFLCQGIGSYRFDQHLIEPAGSFQLFTNGRLSRGSVKSDQYVFQWRKCKHSRSKFKVLRSFPNEQSCSLVTQERIELNWFISMGLSTIPIAFSYQRINSFFWSNEPNDPGTQMFVYIPIIERCH